METDRLTTLDEYGDRKFVIPAEVTGPYRTRRNQVFGLLIFVFLSIPWIKINGVPLLLLDIPDRRFAIFGKMFYAHDGPLIFFVLAAAAMALATVTAIWGRIWCGWACPQTVFIDAVYRRIEIWIEGNYIQRRKLRSAGLTWTRLFKGVLKWSLYFLISALLAHSLMALFAGADRVLAMMQAPPRDNWTYFLIIFVTTGLLMFNFGWFREQFCTIMCPYGRFQSVLMDGDSLTVKYEEKRGDCVSCNRCVEVCPAKIDIRKGLQLECIGCTACIDACNIIMQRVHKAPDLIQYQSLNGQGVKFSSPRVLIYFSIVVLLLTGLVTQFINHPPFSVTILRAKDTPYQVLPDGMVLNHFKLHLFNQSATRQEFVVEPESSSSALGLKVTQAMATTSLQPGENSEVHLFLTFPHTLLNKRGEASLKIQLREKASAPVFKSITAVGPQGPL